MDHQPFEWTCPTCKKPIITWTQKALRDSIEHHEYKHRKEVEGFRKDEEQKRAESAIVPYQQRNYDILPLTATDVGFLETRGIRVDEQDKPNAKRID